MKLNLGCGWQPLEGYVNVDKHCPADIEADFRSLEFSDVEEVVMSHLLEHLSHRETVPVLQQVRGWMRPGALICVEVPDMEKIMANPGPSWLTDVYGVQEHDGEFHLTGFTAETLANVLETAGFSDVRVRAFLSPHPWRKDMPCIEATGRA